MNFEYTLTPDDLREAAALLNPSARKGLAISDVFGFLLLFAALVSTAVTGFPFSPPVNNPISPSARNLWLDVSPSLCVATFMLTNFLVQPTVQRLKAATGDSRKKSREMATAVQHLSWLGIVWLLPIAWSRPVVEWHPSEARSVCAALAPWMFYLATVRFVAVRRRLNAITEVWQGSESLKRASTTTVNQDGVFCGDGLVEYRIHWPGFKRYHETEHLMLLVIDSGLIIFIPKRAIGDLQQMNELKMLIQNNIATGEFKTTPGAFPVITAPAQV